MTSMGLCGPVCVCVCMCVTGCRKKKKERKGGVEVNGEMRVSVLALTALIRAHQLLPQLHRSTRFLLATASFAPAP